ncbi:hypothetical protein B795N_21820 [Marinilactibacillus psychrotolerans]|nr:hypothetical protein B795N_21820 [Marinilactibacillus psychrotolerans]
MEVGCEIIALDATDQKRPDGQTLGEFVKQIKQLYPEVLLMGYTDQSHNQNIADQDFKVLKQILSTVSTPVIAEGKIDTPEKAKKCLELGVHSVVVGSAITRPQIITEKFVKTINQ